MIATAAPSHFPYPDHRTMAEVMRDERRAEWGRANWQRGQEALRQKRREAA